MNELCKEVKETQDRVEKQIEEDRKARLKLQEEMQAFIDKKIEDVGLTPTGIMQASADTIAFIVDKYNKKEINVPTMLCACNDVFFTYKMTFEKIGKKYDVIKIGIYT